MANKGLISVIIPAYNAAAFIEKCISSILSQSYENFEIVVVNDGSKDNTLEILEAMAKKDSRIKVYSQENGGVSAARNTALMHATGEFITYVDSDDAVTDNAFQTMINQMTDDVDLLVCSHNEIRLRAKEHREKPDVFGSKEEIYNRFIELDRVLWWPWGKMFRRSVICDNNLGYDTSITFGEDHLFNIQFIKNMTGKAVVTDSIVYNYYFIRGGLCSKYYPDMHELQKYVYVRLSDYFGGVESTPAKYHNRYTGSYLKGCVEYYIAWLPLGKASDKLRECFEIYSDLLNDEILEEYFPDKLFELIKAEDYKGFEKEYIKEYPKKTIWRKCKRSVRKALEFLQKNLIKKA